MHVSLIGTDSPDYHLELHQQGICCSKLLKHSSKTYQKHLVLQITLLIEDTMLTADIMTKPKVSNADMAVRTFDTK